MTKLQMPERMREKFLGDMPPVQLDAHAPGDELEDDAEKMRRVPWHQVYRFSPWVRLKLWFYPAFYRRYGKSFEESLLFQVPFIVAAILWMLAKEPIVWLFVALWTFILVVFR
jgi:hypothetical protein